MEKTEDIISAVKLRQLIWINSLPYQDKRNDEGHAQAVTMFAVELLGKVRGANSDVVIPAAMLHDVGWSKVPEIERFIVFRARAGSTEASKIIAQLKHQIYGVILAYKILKEVSYPDDLIEEILVIISFHDTREEWLGLNDAIVRDADKLWRYSQAGFENYIKNSNCNKEQAKEWLIVLEKCINKPGFFMLEESREIARREFSKLNIPKIF